MGAVAWPRWSGFLGGRQMGLRTRLGIGRPTAVDPRQSGHQTDRLDGVGDILRRARGSSLLDIGTNRGLVAYEFAWHGARVVHGCDIYQAGITTATEVAATLRNTLISQ